MLFIYQDLTKLTNQTRKRYFLC